MQSFIKKYSIFLMLYIVFQPVLDAITGVMAKEHMSVTFGVFVRLLVMAVTVVFLIMYLLLNRNTKKGFMIIGYFVILALVAAISMFVNYKQKVLFVPSLELTTLAKSMYYPIMLFAYFFAFEELHRDGILNKYFPKVVFYAVNIISVVMIIAHFTHSSFSSYSYYNLGESGWFYAANELSAIVSISFPILVWYATDKLSNAKRWYYWISVVLAVYSALLIGTKGAFIAIIFGTVMGLLAALVQRIQRKGNPKHLNGMIVLMIATLIGIGVAYPMMAVAKTQNLHEEMIKYKKERAKTKKGLNKDQEKYVQTNKYVSYIFSGRTIYFENASHNFAKATPAQKIFGMGYATSFKKVKHAKLVEMDYVDILFQFGFLGAIIYMLPLIYSFIYLLILFFRRFGSMWSFKWAMLVASVLLGFGMALLTGHVIEAPSVSIYFVTSLAFAMYNAKLFVKNKKDPVELDVIE
ncbi:O-antigen ligase family protein [Companilactobacillus sp.]|jgi:hypothetical protein|uniref:O-antigen ligase family protein n=1 Tax=Companilactobacillus sp. TaxID=2767905 RepID=UPI0025C1156E|nr:O-antigen ligase family protein [Companilactobacillus sp.]MCH4008954.1 O-antigen ligase family protein [Companilactobacillus sp.]MCH4050867.1 O-antigen ligase family protein [Companilactobacillus sp.]MCH4076897.1 O-antigen ligase family protein [Companilactobacillus sp.]MCH4125472.1 O-antigen ligase family protein [Companilactobacillus sp.]MCI1311181.1 O-antigen ligase family protein [Companilactobacillus sp.]